MVDGSNDVSIFDDCGSFFLRFTFGEAAGVFFGVLADVLFEGVAVAREAGDGPVEGRNVQFVDGLRVRRAQHANRPAVEAACSMQPASFLKKKSSLYNLSRISSF